MSSESAKIIELVISFISGIAITIGGAWISYLFQKRHERKKEQLQLKHDIYRLLLDIYSDYFWVTTAELHEISLEVKKRLKDNSWKVADKLRQLDSFKYQREILNILFNEGYSSTIERANALDTLIKKLHKEINPNYIKTIREIGKENLIKLGTDEGQQTAPASLYI
ncbi:hypothetical protein [Pontibacter cellulosilyticus]|uniref:Uncharacterized protein n=1 Tax=Pontibacter cellulosilyticus TaxID=1720253 RepID=A0A923N7N8_9BACT|nr:hypothetical protein [Pontibacter cellulosilyticus]MBC5993723.1 hypothetical protein [Pontibacter cellulosilyticus]